jgi:hypothetical protein
MGSGSISEDDEMRAIDVADTPDDLPATAGGKARLLCWEDIDRRTKTYRVMVQQRDALLAERGSEVSAADALTAEGVALLAAMRRDAVARWAMGEDESLSPLDVGTINNSIDRGLDRLGRRPWREPMRAVDASIEPAQDMPPEAAESAADAPAPADPTAAAARLKALLGPLSPSRKPSAAPVREPEPEPVVPCVGDTEPVAGGAATLVLMDIRPDGSERWSIECPVRGSLGVWVGKDIARARAERLAADGKLYAHLAEPAGVPNDDA